MPAGSLTSATAAARGCGQGQAIAAFSVLTARWRARLCRRVVVRSAARSVVQVEAKVGTPACCAPVNRLDHQISVCAFISLQGLKQRHLIARRAVVDRTFACLRYAPVGQRLVMDGHADRKSAGTESMKATPAA